MCPTTAGIEEGLTKLIQPKKGEKYKKRKRKIKIKTKLKEERRRKKRGKKEGLARGGPRIWSLRWVSTHAAFRGKDSP